ncbi:MAG: hypothetical protein HKN44_09875 [Ilumatobacter sp.]|nr:hypothetical protein [Ilumatobacter sp.]
MTSTLARVIQFPARNGGGFASGAVASTSAVIRRFTEDPRGHVDDWGRDAGMFRVWSALSELRWDVSTGGEHHLPRNKGALIVVNGNSFTPTRVFSAFAISRTIDRPVRFVGRPDGTALGAFAQSLGGLLDDPEEVAGALRAGELVVCSAKPTSRPRDVGVVDHSLVGVAITTKTPVLPAATTSSPFSRHARVEIGPPTKQRHRRRGPLAELELADDVRAEIHLLLDELGDIATGTPLDWFPLGGMGGA